MSSYSIHEITWNEKKISRIWDYYSSNPSIRNQYFGFKAGKHVIKEITRNMDIRKLDKILDFSCGPGDLLDALLPLLKGNQKAYGVDISLSSVDLVNERFKDDNNFAGAELLENFSKIYQGGMFDLIISTEVVEHLNDSDLEQMLQEAKRTMKKGGYLVITTPNDEDREANKTICPDCGCIFHRWQHQRSFTAESLKNELKKHSFVTRSIRAVAWASQIRKYLGFIKPLPKNGLIYIGQKT